MNLLLVDDEESVVNALAIRIPWEELGISNVYKCYSGNEAWELFQSTPIDLVISDIRMPGIDGLELIRRIRSIKARSKCILLTGFAEFDYAKEALKAQVLEYLLKPVSDEELMAAVKRLIAQLQEEWQEISSMQRASYTLRQHLPLLRSNLLNDLLYGKNITSELSDKLQLLDIPYRFGDRFSMLMIRMEGNLLNYSKESMHLFEYAVCNMIEEIMDNEFDLWHGKDHHEYLTILLKPKNTGDPGKLHLSTERIVELKAEELQHNVEHYLKGNISILLSTWAEFPQEVPEIYESMLHEMRKLIRGKFGIFKTINTSPEMIRIQSLRSLYEPPLLTHLIEAGRFEDASFKLSAIVSELFGSWGNSIEHINEVYYFLLSSFYYLSHKSGKQIADVIGEPSLELDMNARRSPDQFCRWAEGLLHLFQREMENEKLTTNTSIINRVQQFVEERLADDVSLQAIAEHVYLNPGYLSKLYKLETGENISDYLYRLRMDKSAYYLKNTHLKIQEICERIGYQNTSYFIKMFKKHYHVTPQDYRNG
ncbi:response regulator transcription factor [Paenibacillus glycanilyticus]|uniref:response regulator transcription factor n=1 Tax=Paenibacillus glycanilyticus TaxID=126569 RepID=UPI003EC02936